MLNTKSQKVGFSFFVFKMHEIKSTDCQCLHLLVERFKVTLAKAFFFGSQKLTLYEK